MKRKIDFIYVIEQVLGGLGTAAIIALLSVLYQLINKQAVNLWVWVGTISFIVIIINALVWKYIRKLLTSVGNFIIKYWLPFALTFLTITAYWYAINNNNLLVLAIIFPSLVLITFVLTRLFTINRFQLRNQAKVTTISQPPPTKFDIFSSHLEELLLPQKHIVSGLGLRFLNALKISPPFLDFQTKDPAIPLQAEQAITEYFRAKEFVQNNEDFVMGGKLFSVKTDDSWEKISTEIYGDSTFVNTLKKYNQDVYELTAGMSILTPYINMSYPSMTHDYLERKFLLADGSDDFKQALTTITNKYGLVGDEVMVVLKIAYDAAHRTIYGAP